MTHNCILYLAEAPSKPQSLSVSDVTSDSAKLSWKPPSDDGGAPVTKYVIKRRPAGGDAQFEVVCDVEAAQSQCVVPGLQEVTSYEFALEAYNSEGAGKLLVVESPVKTKAATSKTRQLHVHHTISCTKILLNPVATFRAPHSSSKGESEVSDVRHGTRVLESSKE